jgi:nitrite reductase/ring-hydroxylating ferredoxin subunit
MPVQLHIHTARPLNNDIPPDRIVKWTDEHVRAIRASCPHRSVQVGHQIACAFHAEWIRDRFFDPENR